MRKNEESEPNLKRYVLSSLVGGLLALGVCLVLLLIFSAAVLSGNLPEGAAYALSLVSAAVAALTGGFFAAKQSGGRYLFCGIGAGLVFFILLFLCGALFFDGVSLAGGLGAAVAALLSGAGGGVLGGNTRLGKRHP